MIYATGDIHGAYTIRKLSRRNWPEGTALTRGDFLIICGDFGLVWDWCKEDLWWLKWLEGRPWTTLWVDGNHENHDLIDTLPTEEMFGGLVQPTPGFPHVVHLMRGEIYDLPAGDGGTARVFTMGGANSHDREYRREGKTWWAREIPSQAEYDHAWANLERAGFAVDYVFTHDCPAGLLPFAKPSPPDGYEGAPPRQGDEMQAFLQRIDDRLDKDRLKMWCFGHYHDDRLAPDGKHLLVYDRIVPLCGGPEE